MIHLPAQIKPLLPSKNIENIFFKKYLKQFASGEIDQKIHQLYRQYSNLINCLECANCCKNLEPGIDENELVVLASKLNQLPEEFKNTYVAFDGESYFLKQKPCVFLNNCSCTIYNQRPEACKGFPHLDKTDLKYKKSTWENYGVCPIVFNVIEQLKTEINFKYEQP